MVELAEPSVNRDPLVSTARALGLSKLKPQGSWAARIYARSTVYAHANDEAAWRDARLISFARAQGMKLDTHPAEPGPRSRPRTKPGDPD